MAPRLSLMINGNRVRLEQLAAPHIEGLCECLAGEADGWFARKYGMVSQESYREALQNRVQMNDTGASKSFVAINLKTDKVAGLSHFMKIDHKNRQLEIGGTQIGRAFRRTHVNSEMKLLMLKEAFEGMGFIRVYFKVDVENRISQKAMKRIGAHLEGELRNDVILPDGRVSNYLVFSIIDSEWPRIKEHIQGLSPTF